MQVPRANRPQLAWHKFWPCERPTITSCSKTYKKPNGIDMNRRWSTLAKDFWTSVGPTAILVGFLNPGSYMGASENASPLSPKIVISWVFNEWNWSIIHWLIHWLFPGLPTVCPTARNFQSMQKLIIFVAYFQTNHDKPREWRREWLALELWQILIQQDSNLDIC